LIGLTEQGRAKIEAALPDHIKNIQQALSILKEDDKQDLIRILKNFKKMS
jgi:MarR family 2-MHQ and catechol resistance regulon transcriptional repressor